ncbi:MAG: O-antigen ligase family protein [Clostridia bacterium]|nr:O-antigen ligase family protein [Clostridia bacterium]
MPRSSPQAAGRRSPRFGSLSPLVVFTLIVVIYHLWLSFTRHLWAAENNMLLSPGFMVMLGADFWMVIALLGTLWITAVVHLSVPELREPLRRTCRRTVSPEWILLCLLFVWFMVTCAVYSTSKTNLILRDWRYVLDAGVCALILLPLGTVLGVRRMRSFLTAVFTVLLIFATAFVLIALFCTFTGRELPLPNGLAIRRSKDGDLYMGVNANIGAGIGLTMVYCCLFLAFMRRGPMRWVWLTAAVPHLIAVILCNSRGCFLALLFTLPVCAAFAAWDMTEGRRTRSRILVSALAALLAAGLVVGMRLAAEAWYFPASKGGDGDSESLFHDTGRLYIWPASIRVMTENPKQFFFGVPKLSLPNYLSDQMIALFNDDTRYAHAHNMLLQVGCVQGVPAMAVYAATWVITAVRGLRVLISARRRNMAGAWVIPLSMCGMIIVNVFEPFIWLYFSIMGCVFFLFGGLLTALDRGGTESDPIP